MGLFLFILNYMTPMIVDDYTYCFSFKDGERITSLSQIIIWALDKIILKKERVELWKMLPVVTMLCGYLLIVFAPGTLKKKINVHKDYARSIVGGIQLYVVTFFWLLIIGILLSGILVLLFHEKRKLLKTAVWLFLSFGMNCMLSIAAYRPGRSMAGCAFFLIIADGTLLSLLFDHTIALRSPDPWTKTATWLCRATTGYVCLFMLYLLAFTIPSGVRDIHDTWIQIKEDEDLIRAEVAKGEKDVRVPMIVSSTSYSASNELRYVDPEYYALQNKAMAKYYGARRIYGVESQQ